MMGERTRVRQLRERREEEEERERTEDAMRKERELMRRVRAMCLVAASCPLPVCQPFDDPWSAALLTTSHAHHLRRSAVRLRKSLSNANGRCSSRLVRVWMYAHARERACCILRASRASSAFACARL